MPGHLFNVQRPINGDRAKVRGIEFGLPAPVGQRLRRARAVHAQQLQELGRGHRAAARGDRAGHVVAGHAVREGRLEHQPDGRPHRAYVTTNNALGADFRAEAKAITWLTGQLAYSINDHFRVTLEGRNLLDTKEQYVLTNGTVSLPNGYYPLRPCVHARHQPLAVTT